MAKMAVLGVFFEHLYTDVNGMGNHDINPGAGTTRRLQSHIVAHLYSLQRAVR